MQQPVEIFEVGPRDGLQNEPAFISSADKIALTEALARAGLMRIECASFVSPKWVPQMADGAQVVQGHNARRGAALCSGSQYAGFAGGIGDPGSGRLRLHRRHRRF
jgi:hydroxymethylglutaryl-CoA lyase